MRASLGDESAAVWQETSPDSISVATIHKGEEFEIGKIIRKKKDAWVNVTLDNGVTGFISGNTHIFQVQQVEAIGNDLDLHQAADSESLLLKVIPKKTLFTIHGIEKVGDTTWYRVEDAEGSQGFILAGPRLRVRPQVTISSARRMMITGAIFAAAGIALFFIFPANATDATGGGINTFNNVITLAVVLLGLFQVVQGYMQYRQVKRNEQNK